MKKSFRILALSFCVMLLAGLLTPISAASAPYTTYNYSMEGEILISPHAYTPDSQVTAFEMGMTTELNGPQDIFVDSDMKIYISDTGNSRVVVCDPQFRFLFEIKDFINEHGVRDSLKTPYGLFVNDEAIYVCDRDNSRIVVFNKEGNFLSIINAPTADVMGDDTTFMPVSVGVAPSGTIYIVSESTISGIIALNPDGSFQSFIGAQKTAVPLATRIRRMIFPDIVTESYVSTPYKSLTLDDEGIVWATVVFSGADLANLTSAINSQASSGTAADSIYAPVKRLNPRGDDIMTRTGFTMPCGDVDLQHFGFGDATTGPSTLIDVAIGPNGMWSVLDSKRNRIFTYDSEGNLLFAFGDSGKQLGNLTSPTALSYYGSDLYVLDSVLNSVTVYKRTDYGDVINEALYHNSIREYSTAFNDWVDILKRNLNFDAAYIGIGKNLYRQGEFSEAMEYYRDANETRNYSEAFKSHRKEVVEKNLGWILLIAIAVIVGLSMFFKYVGKVNQAGMTKTGKRTWWEEFLYGFYVIMHPFDGFWDLKHEKRGSVRGALAIVAMTVVAVVYQSIGSAYLFGGGSAKNLLYPVMTVVAPLMLWCVANWCLTTLFDGEGSFKDIFIASSYALVPIALIGIPTTVITNFLSLSEKELITMLFAISYVWLGMLIFFGAMTTHGYSMGRNILITAATIIGMLFILFLILLFTNLIQQMVNFISGIISELSYRAQ